MTKKSDYKVFKMSFNINKCIIEAIELYNSRTPSVTGYKPIEARDTSDKGIIEKCKAK